MKLVKTLSAAIAIASGTLLVACGGSSNSPPNTSTSNDAGNTEADSGPGADAGNSTDAGGVACTAAGGCSTAGDVCCFTSTVGQCVPTASCSGVTVNAGCTTSATCSGQLCCASISGLALSSSCQASCSGTLGELCQSLTDCPAGDTCQTAAGYGICVPATVQNDGGQPDGSTIEDGGASDATGD